MVEDLVRWLNTQLDADTARAEAAPPGPWSADVSGSIVDANGVKVIPSVGARHSRWPEGPASDHIVGHDPARVLREIDAKRRLLDDYTVTARIRDEAAVRIKAAGDHPDPKDLDTWDRAQREATILEGPVRLAASPYSDRPGYEEGWAP